MKRSGTADLALAGGAIPSWLFNRMKQLARPVVEAIVIQHGKDDFLARLSDPFWFQSFGVVIGMDWHSSGVTTAVMSALKQSINPVSKELGLYICGGKGKHSLNTPRELTEVGDATGLDGIKLANASKLSAKVDNTALQDGFNLYQHNFIVSDTGKWSVIQQGMHGQNGKARRYHWHSDNLKSFVEEPHSAICGINEGKILNLVDKKATPTQKAMLEIVSEHPDKILKEIPQLVISSNGDIKSKDIDIKRLGAVLWLAHESGTKKFEDLLQLDGLGPRTLQSLALVSEVIYGTPSRFSDPARFAFAHGGKNAKPFPIPTKTYDETINALTAAVNLAKIGRSDKLLAVKKLSQLAKKAEQNFIPKDTLSEIIRKENENSYKYGGRSARGYAKASNNQLNLFD